MSSFNQPKGMVAYGDMKVMLKRRHVCNVYIDGNFLLQPDPRSILLCIVQKCFVSCHFPSFFIIVTLYVFTIII